MKIGYACMTIGLDTSLKSCILKNATPDVLSDIIANNLTHLKNSILYNIENNIKLFRISSDIIPFASHPVNTLDWKTIYKDELFSIGTLIKKSNMRVSMHPGQYTIINSPTAEVVEKSILELQYHADFLDTLNLDSTHKIIIHIGGVYGEKSNAISRFCETYNALNENIKKRLIIENDDKFYNINDVLFISEKLNVPVVYDNLHHKLNHEEYKSDRYWIDICNKTWSLEDGNQKIHYSQQNPLKKNGSHSETIYIDEFIDFYNAISTSNVDIMLEVKDKNISAIKCINITTDTKKINDLELEWEKYKYLILSKSHQNYLTIRQLLKNKSKYPAMEFYKIIENSCLALESKKDEINAALHIWGYFKKYADEKEKKSFLKLMDEYEDDKKKIEYVKKNLYKLAIKYNISYLKKSYYFYVYTNMK